MNKITCFTAIIGMIISFGFASPVMAGDNWDDREERDRHKRHRSLGGTKFAIEGEYLWVAPGLPNATGDTFENCYIFEEDLFPDDGVDSGIWIDPLFLEGNVFPGDWVQHKKRNGTIRYTASATDYAGLVLAQNGTVKRGHGKHKLRLEAYTVVSIPGFFVLAEVLSKGHLVDECPELP